MCAGIFVTGDSPLDVEELGWCDSRLFQNGTEGAFGHVAGMIGNGRVAMRGRLEPNLVTACSLTVELKSEGFEPLDDVPVFITGQPSH